MRTGTYLSSVGVGGHTGSATITGVSDTHFLMLCDCGREFSVKASNKLKNNGNFACLQCYYERYSKDVADDWYISIIEKRVRADARRADRKYELSKEEFSWIIQQNCYYCNSLPSNVITYKSTSKKFSRSYSYSGIDRVDNSIGYVFSNCVPCCKVCNRAKGNMSQEEFFSWIFQLTKENYRGSQKN